MYKAKFENLADRRAFKAREHKRKQWMIDMVDESDRSIASLVTAAFLSLGIFFTFTVILTFINK